MIVKEFFYCWVEYDSDARAFIEQSDEFMPDYDEADAKGGYVTFTSRTGTFESFVADLYRHRANLLPALEALTVSYGYEGQCNLSFDPVLLSNIGEMGLVLCVTCYAADEPTENG